MADITADVFDLDVLDINDAASLLRCHPVTVKRLAIKGELPGKKLGKLWRFSRKRLIEWLQNDETK